MTNRRSQGSFSTASSCNPRLRTQSEKTDDYEAFFDAFQLPRRRELAKRIAESMPLGINVNQLVTHFPVTFFAPGDRDFRDRMELYVVLLAWSLVHETTYDY